MFSWRNSLAEDALAQLAALRNSQAIIEFDPDGNILTANDNFLAVMGYSLPELEGQHHKLFVDRETGNSAEYREFWTRLSRGEYQAAAFKRHAKDGHDVWIQASYNPVLDRGGRVVKVVKFATDITASRLQSLKDAAKIDAINRSQAVIEFDLNGTIISANENFLNAMGYSLSEIAGKHHSMFVEGSVRDSSEYAEFWSKLRGGAHQAAEFKRLGKGGKEVWILASYNPILDDYGKPFGVVKFATDVTAQKLEAANVNGQLSAINRSQAVIEFSLNGTIIAANANFLSTMGYSLAEIQGKHHRMFVDAAVRNSADYQEFWDSLRSGNFRVAEFKRLAKGEREVWIHASYNPILDLNGRPFKVVKYAADITSQVLTRMGNQRIRDTMELVAGGAGQLDASIQNIAEAMSKSRDAANATVSGLATADTQTKELSKAADSMGGIVELIQSITGQINLLALNATIESARAGQAGRGFAVVAGEVKNLANQAKDATMRISDEIESLNVVSKDVVGNLHEILDKVQTVRSHVEATASAVHEQARVTGEMSLSMQRAAAEAAELVAQAR